MVLNVGSWRNFNSGDRELGEVEENVSSSVSKLVAVYLPTGVGL